MSLSTVLAISSLFVPTSIGCANTVRTRIIEPHARTLELPLLVRSGKISFFLSEAEGVGFRWALSPYPREGISDALVRGSVI